MDQEKLNAMADVMAQGHEVEFDSPDEAKAVETILKARAGSKSADRPAAPIKDINAAKIGATPGVLDYTPAASAAVKSAFGDQSGMRSRWDKMIEHMGGGVKDEFINSVNALPDEERWSVMRDLVKTNYQRDIDENRRERRAAQTSDPMSYGIGQAITGTALGVAGGMAAGPGVAGQGLAGMATGFAMDPSKESTLSGGLAGAGAASIPSAAGSMMRGAGKTLAESTDITDAMLADWLGFNSAEQIALKRSGEWRDVMDVARAHLGVKGPQSARESIELPAIARGAQGTEGEPVTGPYKSGQIQATMDPMPVQQPRQMHPKSWQNPSGQSREIDLSLGNDDQALADFHGENLYQNASNDDLTNMMAPHPAASRYSPGPRKSLAPPGPQEVSLDVIEEPSVPPLSPPERLVSSKLGAVQDKGLGLVHQTPKGSFTRSMANRIAPAMGVGVPELGQKMLQALDNEAARTAVGGTAGGMSSVGRSKLEQLIRIVFDSQDPALEDYLAQEADPSYRSLRMQVDNEQREAENKSK